MTDRKPDIPDINKIKCEDCRYSVDNGAKEKMKTWEALKAADEGEKIRRKCWMKGVYSIKEENSWAGDTALMTHYKLGNKFGTCDNVSLERLEWDDIFASDWEIYAER